MQPFRGRNKTLGYAEAIVRCFNKNTHSLVILYQYDIYIYIYIYVCVCVSALPVCFRGQPIIGLADIKHFTDYQYRPF